MNIGYKNFHIIWFCITIILALFVVYKISYQKIDLSISRFSDQAINETCKNPQDPSSCTILRPSSEVIDVSDILKQLESFDNFFPLSAIAKLDLTMFTSLDSNAFLEVTKPQYSEKIKNIKIACNGEDRFDSKRPEKEFLSVRPVSVNAVVYNYFVCDRPSIQLAFDPEGKKIIVGPSEYVKIVTQGDRVIVNQTRSVLIELDWLTKFIIFLILFFLGLAAGNILYAYLNSFELVQEKLK